MVISSLGSSGQAFVREIAVGWPVLPVPSVAFMVSLFSWEIFYLLLAWNFSEEDEAISSLGLGSMCFLCCLRWYFICCLEFLWGTGAINFLGLGSLCFLSWPWEHLMCLPFEISLGKPELLVPWVLGLCASLFALRILSVFSLVFVWRDWHYLSLWSWIFSFSFCRYLHLHVVFNLSREMKALRFEISFSSFDNRRHC